MPEIAIAVILLAVIAYGYYACYKLGRIIQFEEDHKDKIIEREYLS